MRLSDHTSPGGTLVLPPGKANKNVGWVSEA